MSRLDSPYYYFKDTGASGRHPMDYKYPCGFDPQRKTLKQCHDHWLACKTKECQTKARNWEELKDELLGAYRYD